MQETTIKPLCPVCNGVCGVEVAPGDWFDCDRCDATGHVEPGRVIYTDRASLPKWDARFLELAEHIAAWSKGPRKRIVAVIVRPDRSIASLGYNGPPRGFDDEAFLAMTRDEQHSVVIHAEDNALRQTHDAESVAGYTLYVSPFVSVRQMRRQDSQGRNSPRRCLLWAYIARLARFRRSRRTGIY